jgi:hypothetical protein
MDPLTILSVARTLRGVSQRRGGMGMLGIKNILALIGLVVVAFAGAGWYLGWYQVGVQQDGQGHQQLKIQVDSSRVQDDLKKGKEKLVVVMDQKTGAVTQAPPAVAQQPPAPTTQTWSVPLVPRSVGEIHVPQAAQPAPQPVDTYTLRP